MSAIEAGGAAMMRLHQYQVDVIDELERKVAAGIRRIIITAPTGSGKTVIASEIIKRAVAKSKRVLFIAHRDELLTQARDKLKRFEVTAGIIKAGRDKDARPQALVQVAGIQTLHARAVRAHKMELPAAEIVFFDEAHHCPAMTYQKIIEAYPDAIIVGLTATPFRGDGRGLGNVFEAMIECPQIGELIELGHLVKLKIFAPPPADLRGVDVASTDDYVIDQLSDRMDPLVGDFVEHCLRHAQRRRTVVFAVDVKHSVHIVDELAKSGVRAEHLDVSTWQADREAILGRLASGETEVVSNCMILTEGFDLPDIGCVALVRPTRSLGLFRQMIGRGLRPAEGKTDIIVLDHGGGVYRHGRPDDEIAWSLDIDRRAANPTHEARIAKTGNDPFCECKACGHLRMKGMACDNCGWEPKSPARAVEYIDRDLVELGAANVPTETDRISFYCELRGFQQTAKRKYGSPYHPKWAACQYKDKHKSWPPWSWNNFAPLEPTPATLRWIKSRQIAWAKARAAG
jgi:superfamily II DNA or RNA helicase